MNIENNYIARFLIGQPCNLNFQSSGQINNCRIFEVRHSASKVKYDVGVLVDLNPRTYSIVENVDSAFVDDISESQKETLMEIAVAKGWVIPTEESFNEQYESAWAFMEAIEYIISGKD